MSQIFDAQNTVYVSFSAEVNATTSEQLIATMAHLAGQGTQQVNLLLSTPGGQVANGLNVYNMLRAMPFKLVTHNVGNVDSIGNAIFLAGQERYACPHSTFMFHGVGFDIPGQTRLEEKTLRELLDGVGADQKRIGSILVEHTKLSEGEVGELFREARTKDATFALDKGIVHDVRDINIPVGCAVISLVFQR